MGTVAVDNLHRLRDRAETLLSNREKEVLVLVASGCDGPAICKLLGIAVPTMKNTKYKIANKLGCHQAALWTHYAISHRFVKLRRFD